MKSTENKMGQQTNLDKAEILSELILIHL